MHRRYHDGLSLPVDPVSEAGRTVGCPDVGRLRTVLQWSPAMEAGRTWAANSVGEVFDAPQWGPTSEAGRTRARRGGRRR